MIFKSVLSKCALMLLYFNICQDKKNQCLPTTNIDFFKNQMIDLQKYSNLVSSIELIYPLVLISLKVPSGNLGTFSRK